MADITLPFRPAAPLPSRIRAMRQAQAKADRANARAAHALLRLFGLLFGAWYIGWHSHALYMATHWSHFCP